MSSRVGIELLPYTCRVVEVRSTTGWLNRDRSARGDVRVRATHEMPYAVETPGVCAAELRRVLGARRRDVRLVVWGLRSAHHAFLLPNAEAGDLIVLARREARGKDGVAPAAAAGFVADAVQPGEHTQTGRREVGYVAVSPTELQARLQPFIDAGLSFASVVTPAVAHARIVQRRWGAGAPPAAVLSVNARATALTIVRGGVVLLARELPWGFETDGGPRTAIDPAALAGRLASELRRSIVFLSQQSRVDVGQVLVCGDLADLRALTAPLQQESALPVEILDTADDADAAVLGMTPSQQRAQAAALRVAWTMAADLEPPMSLEPRALAPTGSRVALDQPAQRRLAVGLVAGMLIVAAAWAGASWLTTAERTRADALRRQSAVLEGDVQRIEGHRQATELARTRLAALEAFDTQGPRLARVLEAFAAHTPATVVLTSLRATSAVGAWRITIDGQAHADTPASAQALFSEFLRDVSASSLLGQPVRTPVMTVQSNESSPDQSGAADAAPAARDLTAPATAAAEPHWQLGGTAASAPPPETKTTAPLPAGIERRPGSVLLFSVEFEVRK